MYLLITMLQWKKFNMSPNNKVTNLKVVKKDKETSKVSALSQEKSFELDRHMICQKDAKGCSCSIKKQMEKTSFVR